jgi:ParB/RepB/Spo0J family partition protein
VVTRLPRTRAWERLVSNPTGVDDFYGVKLISLALLDPNPEQPRKGTLRHIPELAASIKEHGLLQPLVVSPPHGGRYVLHAGHRRKAAYDWLAVHDDEPGKWLQVPALVKEGDTGDRLVHALIENLARESLTDAEIITGLRVLHDLRQWNQSEIARHLGVSRAWVMQYFRVANDPVVSEHVQTEHLTVGKAYDIVLAKTPAVRDAALEAALHGAPRRVVRQLVKDGAGERRDRPAEGHRGEAHNGAGVPGATPPGREDHEASGPETGGTRRAGAIADDEPRIATAAVEAGVRDIADLAAELGLTIGLRDLQLTRLFRAALADRTATLDLEAFIRAARADLRRADALVRSAPRPAREV